jgi:hypothetical protein
MIMAKVKRFGLSVGVLGAALTAAAVAVAAPTDKAGNDAASPRCDGAKHGHKKASARFERADANKDGFLTKAEVGDPRWQKLQVADANKDGKLSKQELQQAFRDGKLGHRGKRGEKKS